MGVSAFYMNSDCGAGVLTVVSFSRARLCDCVRVSGGEYNLQLSPLRCVFISWYSGPSFTATTLNGIDGNGRATWKRGISFSCRLWNVSAAPDVSPRRYS